MIVVREMKALFLHLGNTGLVLSRVLLCAGTEGETW